MRPSTRDAASKGAVATNRNSASRKRFMVAMTWIDIGMQYKNFFVDHSFYHLDNKNHNAICSCWNGMYIGLQLILNLNT